MESRATRVGGCDDLLREIDQGVFFPRLAALGWSPVAGESGSMGGVDNGNESGSGSASPTTSDSGTAVATTTNPFPFPYLNYPSPHTSTSTSTVTSTPPAPAPAPGVPVTPTAPALARALQRQSLALMDAFSTPDGSRVDYTAMRASTLFAEYCRLSAELAGGWVMGVESLMISDE